MRFPGKTKEVGMATPFGLGDEEGMRLEIPHV